MYLFNSCNVPYVCVGWALPSLCRYKEGFGLWEPGGYHKILQKGYALENETEEVEVEECWSTARLYSTSPMLGEGADLVMLL